MKRIIALILSLSLVFMLAACAAKESTDATTTDATTTDGSATDGSTTDATATDGSATDGSATAAAAADDVVTVLSKIWGSYSQEEIFAVTGGDPANSVSGAPGKFDISDPDSLSGMLVFPADSVALIDEAASLIHMMNANIFTAGAYHTAQGASVNELVTALRSNIKSNRWLCGFPDTLMIYTIGDSLAVCAFGAADLIETFGAKLIAQYPDATLFCQEDAVA